MKRSLVKRSGVLEEAEPLRWLDGKDLACEALDEAYKYIDEKIGALKLKMNELKERMQGYEVRGEDVDLSVEADDFPAIPKKVEDAVVSKGGSGKFDAWAFSYGFRQAPGSANMRSASLTERLPPPTPPACTRRLANSPAAQSGTAASMWTPTPAYAQETRFLFTWTLCFRYGASPRHRPQKAPEKYYSCKFNKQ
ncbi:MAG: DUF3798 domain-containing protein [Treponema sp.]|nr:DUF3798 domain-containing protein [Treponema sp.]